MAADQPQTSIDDDEDKVFAERMASYDKMNSEYEHPALARELYVIGGGTFDAVKSAVGKDKVETAVEAAGSLALGFAVRAAEARLPILRPALAIGGAALTFAFARDLLGKGSEIGSILSDAWNHEDHKEQDRAAFAIHGGKFAVDLALSSAAGLAGSALGNRMLFGAESNYVRIATYDGFGLRGKGSVPHNRLYSKSDPLAQMYEAARPASLQFKAMTEAGAKAGRFSSGNAFLISEDGLAVTNQHCVNFKDVLTVTDHMGVTHKATVLAFDTPNDVAVLQLEKGSPETVFQPLKLASADPLPGDKFYALSRQPHLPDMTINPGRLRDIKTIQVATERPANPLTGSKNMIRVHPFTREVFPEQVKVPGKLVASERMLSNYFSKKGISGSPVVNAEGEVVGMHVGNLGKWFSQLTSRNSSTPVSAIARVVEEALAKRGQAL